MELSRKFKHVLPGNDYCCYVRQNVRQNVRLNVRQNLDTKQDFYYFFKDFVTLNSNTIFILRLDVRSQMI